MSSTKKITQPDFARFPLYNEGQFRRFVELSPDLIAVHSHGIITYMNPAGVRILGFERISDVVGRPIIELVHPMMRPGLAIELNKIYEQKKERRAVKYKLVRPDGRMIYFEIYSFPVLLSDSDGRQVVAHDITSRVEAERTLRRSRQLFRLLVEGVREYAMYTMDKQGYITSWNQGAERIKGYRRDEIIGKNFSTFFPSEAIAAGKPESLLRTAERKGQVQEEGWRVRKDGRLFWAGILLTAMRDNRGNLVGFSKITKDLTERKLADERLFKEMQQLQAILNAAPLAILTIDGRGVLLSWNKGAEQMFGWTKEEAVGRVCPTVPDSELEDYFEMINKAFGGESLAGHVRNRRKKNGTVIQTSIAYAPITNTEGKTESIIVVLDDITERRRAERQLKESHERLKALSRGLESVREEEKKTIAREIHDQLGQMLTALKMELDTLRNRLSSNETSDPTTIDEEFNSSVGLVDNAIDTVRKIASDLRPGILDHLGLAAAISELGITFEKRTRIKCTVDIHTGSRQLSPEESIAIYRIIQEALTNVARHSRASSVRIKSDYQGGELHVDLCDNGRGIVDEEIFRNHSLGVFGMRERAESIGGSLVVSRGEEGGTVVRVIIPNPEKGGRETSHEEGQLREAD